MVEMLREWSARRKLARGDLFPAQDEESDSKGHLEHLDKVFRIPTVEREAKKNIQASLFDHLDD